MKILLSSGLAAALIAGSSLACDPPDAGAQALKLNQAQTYTNDNSFDGDIEDNEVTFSGSVDVRGTGLVLNPASGIPLNGATSIVVDVLSLGTGSQFYADRLLKIEVNDNPIKAKELADRDKNDTSYVRARTGRFIFPLKASTIESEKIGKFLISFYGGQASNASKINGLKLCVWLTATK